MTDRSRSDHVLTAAIERAADVLLERRHFGAGSEAWDRFMDMLNDPPCPTAALVRLFRESEHDQ